MLYADILNLPIKRCEMKVKLTRIIEELKDTLEGEPWFGQSVYALIQGVNPEYSLKKPADNCHSLVELIYHMVTWADFTLKRIQKEPIKDMATFEKTDWRTIDKVNHSWEEGVSLFIDTNNRLLSALDKLDDKFLSEKVDYREYDFAYLLNGLIQHNIYHAGQVAYVKKLLE